MLLQTKPSSASTLLDGVSTEEAWEQLRRCFRTACVAHRSGLEEEACSIVALDLPSFVDQWSDLVDIGADEKKRTLLALFIEEARRAGVPRLLQEMMAQPRAVHHMQFSPPGTQAAGFRGVIRPKGFGSGGKDFDFEEEEAS